MQVRSNKKSELLWYLIILTSFFILLEISFFIQCNQIYLSDFNFISHKLTIPWRIIPGVMFFLGAQLFLHALFCLYSWAATLSIAQLCSLSDTKKMILGVSLWFVTLITCLLANQIYFPNSTFSALTAIVFFLPVLTQYLFYIFALMSLIAMTLALINAVKHYFFVTAILLLLIAIPTLVYLLHVPKILDASSAKKPNIILVGIDSLRPDFLGFFGGETNTSFIDQFLTSATVFSEAVTPLARTFPSWTSILTGEYPRQNGVRSNLARQDKLDLSRTLPHLLQEQHYQTIFATDETRFSNIDKNYGFNRIVTPPMGLNDFLLGTFNDFPFSNLIINTSLGKWLFPYSYANRPVFYLYRPESFLNLLHPVLMEPRTKPLFLAVHFCLPHYPYLWSGLNGNQNKPLERYQASIAHVDHELKLFFKQLESSGVLKHAIVVMLSDHGEALELPGDRITELESFLPKGTRPPAFYPPSVNNEAINQSAGHGTDVLGLPQYHTLLAIKLYGMSEAQKPQTVTGVVSLLAIKPTILNLMQPSHINHASLLPFILGKQSVIPAQHIFLESDFTPQALRTVYPEERKVLLEGVQIFRIDPQTMRLVVKDEMNKMIIGSKQVADIYGDWMLALYPQSEHERMPILISLKTGQWTNDLHSDFARLSPASEMQKALEQFYGPELQTNTH